jgi:cystathionine gamma-synthase
MLWVARKSLASSRDCIQLTNRSAILNPKSRYYNVLKSTWIREYEDAYWAEDAMFMERNSRDFVSRVDRINCNTEALCDMLKSHPQGEHGNLVIFVAYNRS